MALSDYVVDIDFFEPEENTPLGFSFPCSVCKHNVKGQDEAPCASCNHNSNCME